MSDRGEQGQRPPGLHAAAALWIGGRIAPWRDGVDYIAELVRWRDWRATKLTMYFAGMGYAGLVQADPDLALLGRMAALTAILCLFAAFGHLINDYSDLEADRVAGKKRLLADWSRPAAIGAMTGLAVAILAIAVAVFDTATVALVAASVALGIAYSLPPARLKERATLGWVCATLAQRTLPMVIVFQALDAWTAGAVGLTLLASVTGVRYIIVHQLADLQNDLRAGVQTAATLEGPARLEALIATRIFPLEIAVACATVLAMSIEQPIVGLVGLGYALWVREGTRHGLELRGDSYAVFVTFYYMILPLLLAALLVNRAPVFLPLFALTFAVVSRDVVKITARLMPTYVRSSAPPAAPRPPSGSPPSRPGVQVAPARVPSAPVGASGRDAASEVRIDTNPPPSLQQPEAEAAFISTGKSSPTAPAEEPSAEEIAKAEELAKAANHAPRGLRYPHYARIRERTPIHHMNWPGLGGGFFVMRHSAALTVLKDPQFLKSPPGRWEVDSEGNLAPVRGFGTDLLETDPPDHTRLRKLVSKAFTPRMIERLDGRVEALAHELLDRHLPNGEIELVRDYAAAIPIKIITELLGVEIKDLEKFRQFTYALTFSMTTDRQGDAVLEMRERFTRYLRATFEERRRDPRDDLITALVQAEQDGGRLSADELIGMVYLLLIAGYVTTVNLIANSTISLLRNPGQLELLRGTPSLYPTAIEELLRYDGPLELSSAHFASRDIEVEGVLIPRAGAIRLVMPAINRDPRRFEQPDVLDLTRDPCPHVAFGQGIHYCLGAPLARLEGRIALKALLDRAPGLKFAESPNGPWLTHPILRGPERLRLKF